MLIELLVLGFAGGGTIWLARGRIRPYTLIAVAAVALGLLLGVAGIVHTIAVVGAAWKSNKPYDFRLVSLISTGLLLVFFGSLHVGVSRWIKQGRPWALAISAVVTLYLWIYLALLVALGRQGSTFLLVGFYLFFLLAVWSSSQELPEASLGAARGWRAIRQTGTTLALSALAIQFAVAFGFGWLGWPTETFVAGPIFGGLLAGVFVVTAWHQARRLAGHLANQRLGFPIGVMAAAVVLLTALFRVALELAFRIRSVGVYLTQPTPMDVFVYGTMMAAVLVGAHWDRWRQSRPQSANSP